GQAPAFPRVRPDDEPFAVRGKPHVAPERRREFVGGEPPDDPAGLIVNGNRRPRRQEAQALVVLRPGRRRAHPALPALVVGGGDPPFAALGMNRDRQRRPHLLVALRQFLARAVGQGRGAVTTLLGCRGPCHFLKDGPAPDWLLPIRIDQEKIG